MGCLLNFYVNIASSLKVYDVDCRWVGSACYSRRGSLHFLYVLCNFVHSYGEMLFSSHTLVIKIWMADLVTSIHENWFSARCINTSKPAGEGAIVMQTAAYILVAL